MEVQTRNGILDAEPEHLTDGLISVNASATASESAGTDFPYNCKQFLLDEVDSYMEDLNARLIVTRMVTNSVIKGTINAIEQECIEKVSSKEELIKNLNEKIQNLDAISSGKFQFDQCLSAQEKCKTNAIFMKLNSLSSHSTFKSGEVNHFEYAHRLKVDVEAWIQKLKEEVGNAVRIDPLCVEMSQCRNYSQTEGVHSLDLVGECIHSLESLMLEMCRYVGVIISTDRSLIYEQQLERDIQIENSKAMLQNIITGLHYEYEKEIHGKKTLMNDLKEKWWRKSNELVNLRCELDDLYKSFISWDPGLIFSHVNHENLEERNTLKRKDQVYRKPVEKNITSHDENNSVVIANVKESKKLNNADSPQLMHMTKEELISYFKTEMAKMKRQHDAALQEKTEELFSLKREFLKEKGSTHLNFKKDKEFELMRKRIVETLSKLDDIISKDKNMSAIIDDKGFCSFMEKIDGIFEETRRLFSLLSAKKMETVPECLKFCDTLYQTPNLSVGLERVGQIEKLEWNLEALKFEMSIKDAINKTILGDLSGKFGYRMEGVGMEIQIEQCIYSLVLKEAVKEVIFRINSVIIKCYEEKNLLSENLLEKKELCIEVNKSKTLKQQMESSPALLKRVEEMEIETQIDQYIYSLILKEVVRGVLFRFNNVIMNYYEQNFLSENFLEKKELCLEVDKSEILKQQIKSSSTSLKRNEEMEMVSHIDQCIYSLVLREVFSRINAAMIKCYEEKIFVSESLLEKKKELCLEVDKNKILMQQIESSSTLLEMKAKKVLDLEAALVLLSEQFDSVCDECDMLRDRIIKQEVIITESKKESDLLKCRLEEKFHAVDQYHDELIKIKQTLGEVQKQRSILQSELVENQAELALEIRKGNEQRKQVESVLAAMVELSKSLEELEHKIIDIMQCNESRLKVLSSHSDELAQQANLLKKKLLWYQYVFERRCDDLHKAETEVDLLGDEVDDLISLLGKIYLALEHYSSVLQYYPGVMEVLKLIRREIKGQVGKSF